MTGCTSGGCDQLETSPETIEQELRPAVCERRQTDLWRIIVQIILEWATSLDSSSGSLFVRMCVHVASNVITYHCSAYTPTYVIM